MFSTRIKSLLFAGAFLVSHFSLNAQTVQSELVSLISYLKQLETKYEVAFNYDVNLISNYSLTNRSLSNLEEDLKVITDQTNLIYEKVGVKKYLLYQVEPRTTELEELQQVWILGYLKNGFNAFEDGSFSLNSSQQKLLPGLSSKDVLQSVQAIPGINSVDETISNLSIRGGSNDQNLILWNGIRMYQTGHFFGLISAFNDNPPHAVYISKIINNSQYKDAVSGVIDIDYFSKNAAKDEAGAGVDFIHAYAYGNYNLSKKLRLQIAGRKSITEIINLPNYDNYARRAFQDSQIDIDGAIDFGFYDFSLNALYQPTKNDKIKFYSLFIDNDLKYQNNKGDEISSAISQRHFSIGTTWEKKINDRLAIITDGYFTNYRLESDLRNLTASQSLAQENKLKDFGFKSRVNYQITNLWNTELGLETSQVSTEDVEDVRNPFFFRLNTVALNQFDVYGQSSWKNSSKKLSLSAGYRATYLPKLEQLLPEPRLSAVYLFTDSYKMNLSLGQYNQTRFQVIDEQTDFQGVEKRRWRLTDGQETPVITSRQLHLEFSRNTNDLIITTAGYYKKVENITASSQGFRGVFQNRNAIGNYEVVGVEFLINKKFHNWSTWLTYEFAHNQYNFMDYNNGNSFVSNFQLQHQATFSLAYDYKSWQAATGLNYHSGLPFTNVLNLNNTVVTNRDIIYDVPNEGRLPSYLRLDLSLAHSIKTKKANYEVAASLWNVLNRENIIGAYHTVSQNNRVARVENKALNATFNLSLRATFK